MKMSWTQGIESADKKADIEAAFKTGIVLRGRLKEILSGKLDTQMRSILNPKALEAPNWALQKADEVGYARAMNEIIALINEK